MPIKRRNLADERGAKLARLTIIMAFEIAKLCMIPVKHHFLPMRLAVTELICVLRTASEKDAIPDDPFDSNYQRAYGAWTDDRLREKKTLSISLLPVL